MQPLLKTSKRCSLVLFGFMGSVRSSFRDSFSVPSLPQHSCNSWSARRNCRKKEKGYERKDFSPFVLFCRSFGGLRQIRVIRLICGWRAGNCRKKEKGCERKDFSLFVLFGKSFGGL